MTETEIRNLGWTDSQKDSKAVAGYPPGMGHS